MCVTNEYEEYVQSLSQLYHKPVEEVEKLAIAQEVKAYFNSKSPRLEG